MKNVVSRHCQKQEENFITIFLFPSSSYFFMNSQSPEKESSFLFTLYQKRCNLDSMKKIKSTQCLNEWNAMKFFEYLEEKNKMEEKLIKIKIVCIKLEPRQTNLLFQNYCYEMDRWKCLRYRFKYWRWFSPFIMTIHHFKRHRRFVNPTLGGIFLHYFHVNRQIMAYFFSHYHALNSIYLIT